MLLHGVRLAEGVHTEVFVVELPRPLPAMKEESNG